MKAKPLTCPVCDRPIPKKGPTVTKIIGALVITFCSDQCAEAKA